MRQKTVSLLLPALLLGLTLACGGGSSEPAATQPPASPATGLAYTDPTGSGWRLIKDPSSTTTRLVLNLVGPTGFKTRGIGFNLQAPPSIRIGAFDGGLPIRDTGVYELLSAANDPNEPVALVGGVKKGNLLSVGIYQKDLAHGAKDSGVPLCQIALEFNATAGLSAGDPMPLVIPKAKVIPEDIGSPNDDAWTLDRKMRMADIQIAVGSLSAR
jgi:hypothetical protein